MIKSFLLPSTSFVCCAQINQRGFSLYLNDTRGGVNPCRIQKDPKKLFQCDRSLAHDSQKFMF